MTAHFAAEETKDQRPRGRSPPRNTAGGSSANDGPLQTAIHSQNEETLKRMLRNTVDRVNAIRDWNTVMQIGLTLAEMETMMKIDLDTLVTCLVESLRPFAAAKVRPTRNLWQ